MKRGLAKLHAAGPDALDDLRQNGIGFLQVTDRQVMDRFSHDPPSPLRTAPLENLNPESLAHGRINGE
jgi:hypothetical protein